MHGFSLSHQCDALIGKEAVVTAAISPDAPGYVKVQGELWLARSSHATYRLKVRHELLECVVHT